MRNLRKHGKSPFTIGVVHGGPGAAGQMRQVAEELSHAYGVLEPLQTACCIDGQIEEVHAILTKHAVKPVTLVGHSWGAWLAFMYAARYPLCVKKILLVSSGPFEDRYVSRILSTRLRRLDEAEKKHFKILLDGLNGSNHEGKTKSFTQIGRLLFKTDSFDPLPFDDAGVKYRYDIFQSLWGEAEEMRRTGALLRMGKQIRCPVVGIHGDYDPHPFQGVQEPLSRVIRDFKFVVLRNCGHYPWVEKEAKDSFYQVLYKELG